MGDVEDQQEQDRAQRASLLAQGDADAARDDAQRALEERVADAREGPHKADLHVVDDESVELGVLAGLALEGCGHAGDGAHHVGRGVEDRHMASKGSGALLLGVPEALDGGPHGKREAEALLALVVVAVLQEERVDEQLLHELLVVSGKRGFLATHRTGHLPRQQRQPECPRNRFHTPR